jgi:hypothetical protein
MPNTSPRLAFEIDDALEPSLVTGGAGVPLVTELFRRLGVAARIDAQVPVKQRQRGLTPHNSWRACVALWTSGGDRCQDLALLREDQRPWPPCSGTPCRPRPMRRAQARVAAELETLPNYAMVDGSSPHTGAFRCFPRLTLL